jgi:hypothetical protein
MPSGPKRTRKDPSLESTCKKLQGSSLPSGSSGDGRSGLSFVAELASRELRTAERLTHREPRDFVDAQFNRIEATRAHEDAERLLKPPENLVGSPETELVPPLEYPGSAPSAVRLSYTNTLLDDVNAISVDASEHWAVLAIQAGVLSPALDASVTAGAKNSIEKMLSHEVAAVHHAGMRMLARLENSIDGLPPAERVRFANAAVRLLECGHSAALTLQKIQTGGAQRFVVQQVNVERGGQAVVAAEIGRGSRETGEGAENDR